MLARVSLAEKTQQLVKGKKVSLSVLEYMHSCSGSLFNASTTVVRTALIIFRQVNI